MKQAKSRNRRLNRLSKDVEKEVAKAYFEALKEIRATLGQYYERYDMTMAEMQKYDRLVSLESQIIDEITKLSNKNQRRIKRGLGEIYEEGYYQQAFILESAIKTDLAFTMLNARAIERVIMNKIAGLDWTERMGFNRAETVKKIKEEISRGLIHGDSYQNMSRRLRDRLEVDLNKTARIIRTEASRAIEQSTFDSLEHAVDMGLKAKKMWVAVMDDRTRDSHQSLDGEMVEPHERFSNGLLHPKDEIGAPEEVINCRCTIMSVIEGFEPSVRWIRGEGVVPYTNYSDWKAAKGID